MLAFKATSVTNVVYQCTNPRDGRYTGKSEHCKFRSEIIEIISTKDWCYRSFRDYWKKVQLEGDTYKCPRTGHRTTLERRHISALPPGVPLSEALAEPGHDGHLLLVATWGGASCTL